MNRSLGLILVTLLFFSSCGNDRRNVDVGHVDIPNVSIDRLEQDIFNIDTLNIETATKKLETKYGRFYSSFITGVINNGGLRDSSYVYRIKQFIGDRDMRQAYTDCQQTYPNLDTLEETFTEAFKYFRHYFPARKLPKVITMMSGFNYNAVLLDSTLAIGLEMYLGSNNTFYHMLAFPNYKTMFMNRQNILPDAIRTWMLAEFPYMMDKSDFLSEMTYMGKIMYLTDALLPHVEDTLKAQYSQKQLEYASQNEFNIWSYFAAQKLLYTTDRAEIMKYTADGPFTAAFSKESAPRIGYWMGWQIIRQYMNNNPNITLEQLMNEKDAQKILTKAKYKPGK
ncbi:MAG: gliding motility lipoprotein GldB [Bacteroidota bacterium]